MLDRPGWLETNYRRLESPEGANHRALVRVVQLAGGFHLLVGRDLDERERLFGIIVNAGQWSLALVIVLGLLGLPRDTATCSFPISVLDEQPPAISDPSATPAVLQPPNNQMVDVTIGYGLLENCAGSCSLSVSSNEGVNGPSDGSSSADWEVVDAHHVRLRAKCSGNGWVYTVTITCTDTSGNTGMRSVTVQVPPDPP